ncbi:MAG: hypothetical protein N2544_17800, partial [Burkholderiales bacterium]|nr:hypothetical protein [Burkholderiales bacterium]
MQVDNTPMRIPGLTRSKPGKPASSGESGFAKTVFDADLATQRLLQVVLITGISGSGKSVALAALAVIGAGWGLRSWESLRRGGWVTPVVLMTPMFLI